MTDWLYYEEWIADPIMIDPDWEWWWQWFFVEERKHANEIAKRYTHEGVWFEGPGVGCEAYCTWNDLEVLIDAGEIEPIK